MWSNSFILNQQELLWRGTRVFYAQKWLLAHVMMQVFSLRKDDALGKYYILLGCQEMNWGVNVSSSMIQPAWTQALHLAPRKKLALLQPRGNLTWIVEDNLSRALLNTFIHTGLGSGRGMFVPMDGIDAEKWLLKREREVKEG